MTAALLSPDDFHRAGGPSPKTQANWRVQGLGPKFIKVGSLVRYDPADISAWLDARKVQSTSEKVA